MRSKGPRIVTAAVFGLAVLTMSAVSPAFAQQPTATGPSSRPAARPAQRASGAFPLYPGLEPSVDFWKKVYSEWSEDDVVFHDRDDLSIIYEKIDQERSDDPEEYRENEAEQRAIIERTRRILLDLAARNPDPRTLSGEYDDVYDAFEGKGNPARWRQAADRIRVQRGLRERFHRGLLHAGQYRPHILRIFRQEGVPEELAWLPMVESTFNIAARSSVGAAGVWQFMPGTGRLYMRVDRTVDERLDPILAARGAARLLKSNYRGLGSWPVAVTAYNHGYYGMRRAVRELGTNDYMTIRRHYEGPAFGFASKNFYAEFLAAKEVAENADRYFGPHSPMRAIEFDTVTIPSTIPLRDVARAVQVDAERIWRLNPSLTDAVWRGERSIPAGFALRVPPGYGRQAPLQLAAATAAGSGRRTRSMDDGVGETPRARFYTVRRGDTLSSIAARHGLSVSDLVSINGLRNANQIRVGQQIRLSR